MSVESLMTGGRILPMTRWGQPVMHTPTRSIATFDRELHILVRDMFATMRASGGVGLAATQVGIGLSLFVYHCPDDNGSYRYGAVCNPSLCLPELRERRVEVAEEGCLSLPGAFQALGRPDRATCCGHDPFGQPVTVIGTGMLARCLQHETDHLAGIVFGDRLSSRARRDLYEEHSRVAHLYPECWPAEPMAPSALESPAFSASSRTDAPRPAEPGA